MQRISGRCGCGSVVFEAEGEIEGIVSCHCTLCQRLHGNYNPMVIVNKSDFVLTHKISLAWFNSSPSARRGFCSSCGSALFKEQLNGPKILVAVGSLNDTTQWHNHKNVFVEEAGKYYLMPEGEQS